VSHPRRPGSSGTYFSGILAFGFLSSTKYILLWIQTKDKNVFPKKTKITLQAGCPSLVEC